MRGHEIILHTQPVASGRHLCFAFLHGPFEEHHELKIFKGWGAEAEEAEEATLREVLGYLDQPSGKPVPTILAARNTLHVAGRKVDVFCDALPDGSYQAFPFLYRPDGTRVIIMRFHLAESITADSPARAISTCIRRLEDHFLGKTGEDGGEPGA